MQVGEPCNSSQQRKLDFTLHVGMTNVMNIYMYMDVNEELTILFCSTSLVV